ncbi:Hypothetical predicted protein [Paramuricea clavata]|uniref:Uncharacterized protein n=1 Tax=Paramuricea clavata TaxID=317549 RepID=A0A6S7IMG0_PARCT|nr:Hypothetical predicted protein [Paramuricea clavata]
MSVLKDCLPVVLDPITNIVNCSFATSTFPDDMKLAEVIPFLKDGDHEIASNNRPLSLLNTVSKICERAVLNQLNSYLTRNKRLSVQQSGNKKQHSTETLNLLITDHLLDAMDNKKLSAVILIDLSKAFDTLPITHGVPQGAILSPLLFCIYTNDLLTVTQSCDLNSFVDDSKISLSFSVKEVSDAKHKLETDLRLVAEWCCKNSLLINPEKTKFLLVGTRQLLNSLSDDMSLNFLNKTIVPVTSISDLGIILDRNLTYNEHITQLSSECMAKLCQINRVKHCFDQKTLIYIICAVVMGKLYYCSTVWSNTSSLNIKKLQAVQNFACRILGNGKKIDHITPILKDIGWLPVKEHLLFKDLVMIYKCINSLTPTYLCDLFLKRKELNNRATRNNEALHIPLFSTTTGQRSFRYRAVGLWNSLDNELKKLPLATFKIKLKEFLLSRYFET